MSRSHLRDSPAKLPSPMPVSGPHEGVVILIIETHLRLDLLPVSSLCPHIQRSLDLTKALLAVRTARSRT